MTREGLRVRGRASGRGCRLRRVKVSVARKVGKRCRFLRADGTFSKRRSCLRTSYLNTTGKRKWSFRRTLRLPKGKYLIWSRAVGEGGIERKAKTRNMLRTRRS